MKKMLVLRLSAIGDVAMTVHAVRSLREKYPDLGITLGTRKRLAGFYEGVKNINFLFFPEKAGICDIFRFVSKAKSTGFDFTADLQNNLRTTIIRLLMRLGGSKVASYKQMTIAKWRVRRRFRKDLTPLRNNVLRFCDVFAALGFPVPDPEVIREVRPVPAGFGSKKGIWAGIAPFSRKEKKIYPLDSCAELIRLMSSRFDKVFIFSGPGKEKMFCEEMMSIFPCVETVFGRTDLAGETALISNLDILVTMDSATMHMATLTGAPYVAIWGGTHPSTGYSAYGADWKRNYIQVDLPCRPCSSYGEGSCRYGDFHCLEMISPNMIIQQIEKLTGLDLPRKA
jgi:ADP-heptose:LPS heptosyltransferase